MVRAPQRAGGALLDQLHPGNRLLSTPERGGPGRTTQHGPLLGPGLPSWRCTYHTFTLSKETYTFPHQYKNDPGRGWLPVWWDTWGHYQANPVLTPQTVMRISRNLAPNWLQHCGLPDRVTADFQGDHLLDQGKPPRGPAPKISRCRVSGGVSPRVWPASNFRGMDLDTRMVQGRRRPPLPPPPTRAAITTMKAEREALYRHVPLLGQPISVEVQPFTVEDSIPAEEDISWVVRRLCLKRSGGPPGISAEHLC